MITVLGAGEFGTALALALSNEGTAVTLVGRSGGHVTNMQTTRFNAKYLPGVELPPTLVPALQIPERPSVLLAAVPLQRLRGALEAVAKGLRCPVVACCKGVERQTGLGATSIISEICSDAEPAVLTGPSFAADIARGKPTALTLACQNSDVGKELQTLLSTPKLRLYRSTDTRGAEIGGALKNVIAIACGAAIGAELGTSARAALTTRGFAEMRRIADVFGARPETLNGLSGFGDLVLTCTSEQSRNYQYGRALGSGAEFSENTTVEGKETARAVATLAAKHGITLPVTETVVELVDGTSSVQDAMAKLMTRPLKEE